MVGFNLTKGRLRNHDRDELSRPPPPYTNPSGSSSSSVVAEVTTTTTVTTTTQTTHTAFFSLPLFRKRPSTANSSLATSLRSHANENEVSATVNEHGLRIDKDLPEPPHSEDDLDRETESGVSSEGAGGSAQHGSSAFTPNPTSSFFYPAHSTLPSRSIQRQESTSALARAALGLSLTHTMPFASAATSPIEPNTPTAFKPSITLSSQSSTTDGSNKERNSLEARSRNSTPNQMNRRRSRGLSLIPLISSGPDKEKTKFPESPLPNPEVEGKPIQRRSSFWGRRRLQSLPKPSVTPELPHTLTPALPSLQPVSPFFADTQFHSSPPSSPTVSEKRANGLRRRHSDRSPSYSSSTHRDESFLNPGHVPPPIPTRSTRRPPPPLDGLSPVSYTTSSSRPSSFADNLSPPIAVTASGPPTFPPPQRPLTSEKRTFPTLRPRSATSSPRLLHRLSMGVFASSPSTPEPSPITSSTVLSGSSKHPNTPKPTPAKSSLEVPKPRTDEESPEIFLGRIEEVVSKLEIGTVLASSNDSHYAQALHLYIGRFEYTADPLDVALRKLLMHVGLPKETQQIDRVVESFAKRYTECNPGLFISDDHPYILAFSMIMLHTDAFNKSNKRKMSKVDYIKNVKPLGIPSEVLDCFYDNIVFAPFIFIEDPLDVNGQRDLLRDANASRTMPIATASSVSSTAPTNTGLLGKNDKIDPYYIIIHNLLDNLRAEVEAYVPRRNPYTYQGTAGSWKEEDLHRAFALADVIEVATADSRRMSTMPFFGLSVGGAPSPMMGSYGAAIPDIIGDIAPEQSAVLKVAKVGLLWRKEDLGEGGKKASGRKWKEWSVILTGSQLLFFKDSALALNLIAQTDTTGGHVLSPHESLLKPDELLSIKDVVAVFDASYIKHENALRVALPTGRHFLLRAESEQERNEWIAHINYASAFKTAGIRMRALAMSEEESELTGMAAAQSHLHDQQPRSTVVHSWKAQDVEESLNLDPPPIPASSTPSVRRTMKKLNGVSNMMDLESVAPSNLDSSRFKITFDQVKADLAAGRRHSEEDEKVSQQPNGRLRSNTLDSSRTPVPSPTSPGADSMRLQSRPRVIRSKISELEGKISISQTQLDSDLRLVRNLAILTPFQRSTRSRLQTSVISVASKIMQVRLDMVKMVCHRDILVADLAAQECDWQLSKNQALKAATEALDSQRRSSIPQMKFSAHEDDAEVQPMDAGHRPSPDGIEEGLHKSESSICESFHSALDFGPDWPSHARSLSSFKQRKGEVDTPGQTPYTESSQVSRKSFPFEATSTDSPQPGSSDHKELDEGRASNTGSEIGHDRFYTAQDIPDEEAEDWDKTRAAKRVSLVRLPSDLKVAGYLGRHRHRTPQSSGS